MNASPMNYFGNTIFMTHYFLELSLPMNAYELELRMPKNVIRFIISAFAF